MIVVSEGFIVTPYWLVSCLHFKKNNISMAVCTNKQEHLAVDLLKKIGIYKFFDWGGFFG